MRRLRGTMVRAGVGLGRAAMLRAPNLPPAPPPALAARLLRDPTGGSLDRLDVVVVAESYADTAALILPWARVTAIAVERAYTGDVLAPVPAVSGVEGLLEAIEDEEALVLVDGDRAMVLVEPDAETLAAFQAARQQIGPRRRLFLEYAHQPARALDGREVRVVAGCHTAEEVRQAVEAGADALYLPADAPLLVEAAEPVAALTMLTALSDAAGGKPVTLAGDAETVDTASLLQAARRLDAVLAVRAGAGPDHFATLREHFHETGTALLTESVEYGDVLVAARLAFGDKTAPLGDYGVGRVVVEEGAPSLSLEERVDWLGQIVDEAAGLLLPVEVDVPGGDPQAVELCVAFGAAGVVVPPATVQATKDLIRGIHPAEARGRLLGLEREEG